MSRATAPDAGNLKVDLHLSRRAMWRIASARRHGWAAHIHVWVTFTPIGGVARREDANVQCSAAHSHRAP
jgi:hypothetical protein